MTPTPTPEAAELAGKLTAAQKLALLVSADGWRLSFYVPYGAQHNDRGGAVGRPYWSMRKGLDTPKPPHWASVVSLQNMGLIQPGSDCMPCTPLGAQVAALLLKDQSHG